MRDQWTLPPFCLYCFIALLFEGVGDKRKSRSSALKILHVGEDISSRGFFFFFSVT